MVSKVNYRPEYLVSNNGSITIQYLSSGYTNIQTAGGGGGTPSAPDTSVQFNNAGAFGGSANFTYVSGTNTLTVGNLVSANFTSAAQGLVPASGGGTSNFLRADGTFAAPPTTAPASPTTSVQFNSGGAFGGSANFTYTSGTNTVSFGNITGSALAMTIQPLAPTSGSAGALTVQARAGVATNGAGGALNLTAGSSVGTANGGNFTCTSGNGNINSGANGGAMFFTGGSGYFGGGMLFTAGAGGAFGGGLSFAGGSGSTGGNVNFASGAGTSGSAGNFNFSTALGNLGSGNMLMQTGEVTFSGNSGTLTFNTGSAAQNSEGGLSGNIFFNTGNTGSESDGWSGTAGNIIFNSGSDIGSFGSAGDINFTAGYGAAYNGSINISTVNGTSIQLADNGARQLGFFGVTPVVRPTTSTTAATFVANSGTTINSASTFDGYTLAKVVKALRNLGILT